MGSRRYRNELLVLLQHRQRWTWRSCSSSEGWTAPHYSICERSLWLHWIAAMAHPAISNATPMPLSTCVTPVARACSRGHLLSLRSCSPHQGALLSPNRASSRGRFQLGILHVWRDLCDGWWWVYWTRTILHYGRDASSSFMAPWFSLARPTFREWKHGKHRMDDLKHPPGRWLVASKSIEQFFDMRWWYQWLAMPVRHGTMDLGPLMIHPSPSLFMSMLQEGSMSFDIWYKRRLYQATGLVWPEVTNYDSQHSDSDYTPPVSPATALGSASLGDAMDTFWVTQLMFILVRLHIVYVAQKAVHVIAIHENGTNPQILHWSLEAISTGVRCGTCIAPISIYRHVSLPIKCTRNLPLKVAAPFESLIPSHSDKSWKKLVIHAALSLVLSEPIGGGCERGGWSGVH